MSKYKPNGYWKKIDNTLAEAKKAMEEQLWNELPGSDTLYDKGYGSLRYAISSYHGGFHKFRKLLGQEQKRLPLGRWKDLEFTLQQARDVMKTGSWEELPCGNELVRNGYSSLMKAIKIYHGGMYKFRKLLGQEQRQLPNFTWQNVDYTFQQAKVTIKKEKWGDLPGADTLYDKGYGGLANAISRYHSGFPHFRALLKEKMTGKSEAQRLTSLLGEYAGENDE